MSSRRKVLLKIGLLIAFVVVLGLLVSSRTADDQGPVYQGRTALDWLHSMSAASKTFASATNVVAVFRAMDTNALPFLASRITRNLKPSVLELVRTKVSILGRLNRSRGPIHSRREEAETATTLLWQHLSPPAEMLVPLLAPALRQNSDWLRRHYALHALQGLRSGYELARPYVEQALRDPDPRIQAAGADVVRAFGPAHGGWAAEALSPLITTRRAETFTAVLLALHCLETNSVPLLPKLKQRWATEQDQGTRDFLAHSIRYISHFDAGETKNASGHPE
jgi:hypothetical protein